MLGRITQSLPDMARLNEYRVESKDQIVLDGGVLDETLIYEFVNNLRRLPDVSQVALQGTSPEEAFQGTRFVIQMTTSLPFEDSQIGVKDE